MNNHLCTGSLNANFFLVRLGKKFEPHSGFMTISLLFSLENDFQIEQLEFLKTIQTHNKRSHINDKSKNQETFGNFFPEKKVNR